MLADSYVLGSIHSPIHLPWISSDHDVDKGAACWMYSIAADTPSAELVLAPVHRERWRDLYQITFAARNRPGVFAAVAELLRQASVNILCANGAENGGLFHIRMTVDCRRYTSPIDGRLEDRVFRDRVELRHLQMLIETRLLDRLEVFGGNPNLSISRNETLWKLHHQVAKSQFDLDFGRQLVVENGAVKIPLDMLRNARADLAAKHGISPACLHAPIWVASIDESRTLVRILVTYEELGVMKLRVSYLNAPGALAVFTEWLREHDYDLVLYKQLTSPEDRRNTALTMIRDLREAVMPDAARAKARFLKEALDLPNELQNIGLRLLVGRRKNGKLIPVGPCSGDQSCSCTVATT